LVKLAATVLLATSLVGGCAPASHETARDLFDRTVREYHLPSAETSGVERERLLARAASGYEQVLQRGNHEPQLCAAALRSLANVRAEQGHLDEAVKLYSRVGQQYTRYDWEVLQAWKTAGDSLWDAGRHQEAATFYRMIAQRFDGDTSPLVRSIVSAASRRA
jgi:lipopolysaccharide biosynthesis regulator YciM